MNPMSHWKASNHSTQRQKHAKQKIRGNKQMLAQKQIYVIHWVMSALMSALARNFKEKKVCVFDHDFVKTYFSIFSKNATFNLLNFCHFPEKYVLLGGCWNMVFILFWEAKVDFEILSKQCQNYNNVNVKETSSWKACKNPFYDRYLLLCV